MNEKYFIMLQQVYSMRTVSLMSVKQRLYCKRAYYPEKTSNEVKTTVDTMFIKNYIKITLIFLRLSQISMDLVPFSVVEPFHRANIRSWTLF